MRVSFVAEFDSKGIHGLDSIIWESESNFELTLRKHGIKTKVKVKKE